jgi:hypothetical protein
VSRASGVLAEGDQDGADHVVGVVRHDHAARMALGQREHRIPALRLDQRDGADGHPDDVVGRGHVVAQPVVIR